jgi:DNA polymerase III alpha subunit
MKYDDYGRAHCTSDELCNLLYKNKNLNFSQFLIDDALEYNENIKKFHVDFPKLSQYENINYSIKDFDELNQQIWHMPSEFKDLDIDLYVRGLCTTQEELNRVEQELLLFHQQNLGNLLRFLVYLVDTLRKNKIVWGVGRGSSVSSYVLFLIGIHKIDSIKYNLDIKEFLK